MRTVLLLDHGSLFWACWHGRDNEADSAATRTVNRARWLASNIAHDAVAVCVDSPRNWRHDIYAGYKANREAKPQESIEQLKLSKKWLEEAGFQCFGADGFEADDVIASGCANFAGLADVVVATADKDMCQLATEGVRLYSTTKNELLDEAAIATKFGVPAARVGDWLALVGDTSDNVPGAPGVGPKKASALLSRYDSIDAVIAGAAAQWTDADLASGTAPAGAKVGDYVDADIKPAERKSLIENADTIRMSRRLVALAVAPVDWSTLRSREAETVADDDNGPGSYDTDDIGALFDLPPIATADELLATIEPNTTPKHEVVASAPPPKPEPTTNEQEQKQKAKEMTTQAPTQPTSNGAPAKPVAAATAALTPTPTAPVPAKPTGRPMRPSRFLAAVVGTGATMTAGKTIVTGPSGIGKTRFLTSIPRIFYADLEDGLIGIPKENEPAYFKDEKGAPIIPSSLEEYFDLVDLFMLRENAPNAQGQRPYLHFATDGLTGIERLVHKHVTKKESVEHMEAKEYKKLWHASEPVMGRVQACLDKVRAAGVNVWLAAHSAEVVESNADTGEIYRRWDLLLKGGGEVGTHARNFWRGWAHNVFFIDKVMQVTKGDKSKRSIGKLNARVIYTRESGVRYAKARDQLPESLPCTWEDLRRAMISGGFNESKVRGQIEDLITKLPAEDAQIIQEDYAACPPGPRLMSILSRAQGMLAVAAEGADDVDVGAAENDESGTDSTATAAE